MSRAWSIVIVGFSIFAAVMSVVTLRQQSQGYTETAVKKAVYKQEMRSWVERVNSCERGKLDRASIAQGFNLDADGWTQARGRAESQNQPTFAARYRVIRDALRDLSADISSRTGKNLDCFEQTRKPTAPKGTQPIAVKRDGKRYVLATS